MNEIKALMEFTTILHDDARKEVPVRQLSSDFREFIEDYRLNPLFYLENAPATTLLLLLNDVEPRHFFTTFAAEIENIRHLPYVSQRVEEYLDIYKELKTRPEREVDGDGPHIGLTVFKDGTSLGNIPLSVDQFIELAEGVLRKKNLRIQDKYSIILALKAMDMPRALTHEFTFSYTSKIVRPLTLKTIESEDSRLLNFIARVGSNLKGEKITVCAFFLENLKSFYYEPYCSFKGLRSDTVASVLKSYVENGDDFKNLIATCAVNPTACRALRFVASYDTVSKDLTIGQRVISYLDRLK